MATDINIAKGIADINKEYTDFSKFWRQYEKLQNEMKYEPKRYAWFRPEKLKKIRDEEKVAKGFSVKDLQEKEDEWFQKMESSTVQSIQGNVGDITLFASMHDIIVSANKTMSIRYRSKLRTIAHANGIAGRLGHDYGDIAYIYDRVIENTKVQATK